MAYKQAPSGASIGTGGDWAVRVARWPDYTASPSRRLHHVDASCSSASCSTDELMLVPTSIRRLPALQWRRRDMEEARRVAARWRARPRAHVLVFPLESAAFSGALSQRTDRAGLAHSKMVPAGVGLPADRNGAECTELGSRGGVCGSYNFSARTRCRSRDASHLGGCGCPRVSVRGSSLHRIPRVPVGWCVLVPLLPPSVNLLLSVHR